MEKKELYERMKKEILEAVGEAAGGKITRETFGEELVGKIEEFLEGPPDGWIMDCRYKERTPRGEYFIGDVLKWDATKWIVVETEKELWKTWEFSSLKEYLSVWYSSYSTAIGMAVRFFGEGVVDGEEVASPVRCDWWG